MEPKKLIRSTNAQINLLTDYMSTHRNFANGKYTGPLAARRIAKEWEFLRGILKERGPDKSVDQWKQTWRDLKRKARKQSLEANTAMASTGNHDQGPFLPESSIKILNTIKKGMSSDDEETPPPADANKTPKQLQTVWVNLKHSQKQIAHQQQLRLSTEGNSSNDGIESKAVHETQANVAGGDSSMDSDTVPETVETELIQSEPGISGLYLSEESQNTTSIETPCYTAIEIKPIFPQIHPEETIEPIPLTNIDSQSTQNQENSTTKSENKSKDNLNEIHKWEIQLIKEKIKHQQQESMKRETRATAIYELEHQLLVERIREAKAKANLAELLLRRQQY